MVSPPYARLSRDLRAGRVVLIDGATGTELERRGAAMHERAWCARATLTHPEVLGGIHRDYIRAGCRLITTNTFSTNRNMLEPAGLGSEFAELNRRAVAIALQARAQEHAEPSVVVAGSLSHQVPAVAAEDGTVLARKIPPLARAEANFRELAAVLAAGGVDLILLEMMSQPELANLAIDAARATGLPFWVGFSVDAGAGGSVRSYSRPDLTAGELFAAVRFDDADAAGIMHSSVNATGPALAVLREHYDGPLMAYPESGHFIMPHWHFENVITPAALVEHSRRWIRAGVQILGGCCGLGVEHMAALARSIAEPATSSGLDPEQGPAETTPV